MPWILRHCFFMVDRFHFQGHTFCDYYNPDRYSTLLKQRSVAAEVMNSVLDKSASFIRYLKGYNIRPYLRIMFALHNFTAVLKDSLNRKELPAIDLGALYNAKFKCTCYLCIVLNSNPENDNWKHTTLDSISMQPIYPASAPEPPSIADPPLQRSAFIDDESCNDDDDDDRHPLPSSSSVLSTEDDDGRG